MSKGQETTADQDVTGDSCGVGFNQPVPFICRLRRSMQRYGSVIDHLNDDERDHDT